MGYTSSGTGFQGHSDTSAEAAEGMGARAGLLRAEVLGILMAHGGMTDEEIHQRMSLMHPGIPRNSVAPRRVELMNSGYVVDSGQRRLTEFGKRAAVWIVKGEPICVKENTMTDDICMTIDLETAYDSKSGYTLKKMTTEEYIRSPFFEAIGVGLGIDGEYEWMEWDDFLVAAKTIPWQHVTARMHHAHFDALILKHHAGILCKKYQCTLSMGRALHGTEVGNSLGTLAKHYGVGEKGDEVIKADGKRRKDFSQAEWEAYGNYCRGDCKLTDGIFDKMMAAGFPTSELPIVDLTVKMFADPQLVLDRVRTQKFVDEEKANKTRLLAKCGVTKLADGKFQSDENLLSNEQFAKILTTLGVDPPMKWSEKKKRLDYAFAKSDPEFMALKDHDDVGDLVKARLGVKSTINETRGERLLNMHSRGRLCVYIRTSGAHTHRWTGAEKMNWQNLERVDDDAGKGTLRKCLRAPDGYRLVVADSGQIEARVCAWLCGQQDLVEGFERNEDIYSQFASIAYGRPVDGKNVKADKPKRLVGKICRLGLQFGMGHIKLASQMLAGPIGNPPVTFTEADAATMGVDVAGFITSGKMDRLDEIPSILPKDKLAIHAAACDHLVNVYRAASPKIIDFWYEACPALLDSMLKGEEEQCGPIRTKKNALILPNGLELRYPDLKTHDEKGRPSYSYWKAHSARSGYRSRMYGGLLTENIVQALARVIITDQLNALYDGGFIGPGSAWKVVTTTHDEVVLCVPEADAERASEVLITMMTIAPEWAEGLPLSAEGGHGVIYGEIK